MASDTGGVAAMRELHALAADVNDNFRVDSKDICGVVALQELHALAADVNVNFHVSRPPRRVKRRNSALKLSPSMEILSIAEEIFGAQHLPQAPDQQNAVLRGLPAARSAENADGDLSSVVEPLGQATARAQQVEESWRGRAIEERYAVAAEPVEIAERGTRRERLSFGFPEAREAGGARSAREHRSAETGRLLSTRSAVGDVDGWWNFVGEMEGEMRSDCSGSSFDNCRNWSRCSSMCNMGSCFDSKDSPVASFYNGSHSTRW